MSHVRPTSINQIESPSVDSDICYSFTDYLYLYYSIALITRPTPPTLPFLSGVNQKTNRTRLESRGVLCSDKLLNTKLVQYAKNRCNRPVQRFSVIFVLGCVYF